MSRFLRSWTISVLKLNSYEWVATIATIIYTQDFFIKKTINI